jgi:serine/threonine protein kinase
MSNYPNLSLNGYEINRELGRNREGGRVSYLATKISTEEIVVIKQFRFFCADTSWQGFKVYEREVDFLKQLNHPRIPRYIDSFETDDGFCLVQEYKDAPSLADVSNLSPEVVKQIAISVLEILVDLQKRNPPIIHRDLKPENILIDAEYNAYLIDFGLAKIPDQDIAISSIAAGTPGFMPPEEVFNRAVTKASDLYSLGATLICLLMNTPSTEVASLIDDNYRFDFQEELPHLNSLFLQWLTKMVEPNFKARIPDAITALTTIQQIDVYTTSDNNYNTSLNQLLAKGSVGIGFLAIAVTVFSIFNLLGDRPMKNVSRYRQPPVTSINPDTPRASDWFLNIKPHCNAVEVSTFIQQLPPPDTAEGKGYAAACYALAGKIELADRLIESLSHAEQQQAVNIVFHIGHPVADAGDDESAGPIMNLVVKYQPNNYMALYHAGMSAYILGDLEMSEQYLTSFLEIYHRNDDWRNNAITVLKRFSENYPR